jgi:TatD DNase family protein
MIVDSHCHLGFEKLSEGIDDVVSRARAAGIGRIVTIGTTRGEFQKTIEIAEQYDDVFCALGIHPQVAEKEGEEIDESHLVELMQHPKVIGIGETGLDFFYDSAPHDAQERVFRTHIRAAIKTGLPLIIHTRDAEEATIRILSEERKGHENELKGVFHCYSSNAKLASYGQKIGFYFSFSGMLTFKKSDNVRDVAKDVPLDRLLVETDAPYLAPEPYRGKTCEPAYVAHTCARLALVKGITPDEMARRTTENFFALFGKAT